MVDASRFDIVLVRREPTVGSEIRKTRPCVEMNQVLRTVIVAPMTTRGHAYPWRVAVTFAENDGHIALDQIRAVDRQRLAKRLGKLNHATAFRVLDILAEMFAP